MRPTCTFLGLAFVAIAALSGCGGEARDATSKELSALTAEISKLRAEQAALGERLSAIERSKAAAPAMASQQEDAPAAPAAAKSLDDDRPALDVVRLGPTDEADDGDGDVDADGPRTVLRSGNNGIIVEEQAGPGAPARTLADPGKKPVSRKADKADRKKTAALPTP
jgi:hypothetical protein